MEYRCLCLGALLVLFCAFPVLGFTNPLPQAIRDYNQENYEEALQVLETLRASGSDAELSFYLGMTHYQMGSHRLAQQNLEEAQRLGMSNDRIFKVLAECSLAHEDYNGALFWLREGGRAGFSDGEMSYLKGLALARQGDYPAALAVFDEAEKSAPEISGKIDYLRAQVYVAGNDYEKATQALEKIITAAPESDLAETAREFNRTFRQLARERRDWRGTLQLGYLYDSNAIAEPETKIPGLPDAEDHGFNGRLRLEYVPVLGGNLLFSSRYDLTAVLYDENATSDQVVQSLAVAPGYQFSGATLTLPLSYAHTTRDGDKYQQVVDVMPTLNLALMPDQILQLGLGYAHREMLFDYANASTEALESRDGDIVTARIGYYYLFAASRGMANATYAYVDEQTDGRHWESRGHRVALSGLVPIGRDLSLDLYADVFFQGFEEINSNFSFNDKRSDATKTFSAGISWDVSDPVRIYARYQYTRADSNLFLYEHRRSLAMLGMEFSF